MNEAPRKIWYDTNFLTVGLIPIDDSDTPYIRADLVDGLVEALEVLLKLHDNEVFVKEPWDVSMEQARAAIAKARGCEK